MNNMDAPLDEADRSINDLKLRGVYIHTPVNDKPLDLAGFVPLYEKMSQYNLPIFIHPMKMPNCPDFKTEEISNSKIWGIFGWLYETIIAVARLVLSGTLERYSHLKIVTHHCGGMIPYFADRAIGFAQLLDLKGIKEEEIALHRDAADYYRCSMLIRHYMATLRFSCVLMPSWVRTICCPESICRWVIPSMAIETSVKR